MNTCPITVAIPTYRRSEQLLKALRQIQQCNPRPDEIIVHIDNNDAQTEAVLQGCEFVDVIVIKNLMRVGPGGGRNIAIAQAQHPIVASFDDDSYPIDSDYFGRLLHLFEAFPEAAVIGAAIYHQHEKVADDEPIARWTADFVGCGCAYRKDVFLQTNGYIPLPLAYGMEEVDLSLRLHHTGWRILQSPWLRVFHDTKLEHHNNPKITAASIANQALLIYLRYPVNLWGLGGMQCLNRVFWLIRHQQREGVIAGLLAISQLIQQHQHQRQAVSTQSLSSYLQLRRHPISFSLKVQ